MPTDLKRHSIAALADAIRESRAVYVPGTPEKYPEAELLGLTILDAEAIYEQLEAAETTLAHALDFIEHQDMNYRWAEWCEGRNPSTPASREPS